MKYDFAGLPNRIKEAREKYAGGGMSREQLGKLVGNRSRQAVARWEQPYDRDRNSVPDLETIRDIAEALRIDFLWLLTGQRYAEDTEDLKGILIPVFRLEDYHSKAAPLFHKRTLSDVPDGTDGFRVSDLSNAPEYMPSDVVAVEPCHEPRPGKMMVARLAKKGVNIFARCVLTGIGGSGEPIFALIPLKADYPKFSSADEEIQLLAVAIEHHKDLRNRE